MVMPRKRELAAYWILREYNEIVNYGTAIDLLRRNLCVTRKVAINIIKRLKKLGLIKVLVSENEVVIKVASFDRVIKQLVNTYINARRARSCKT